MEVRKMSTTNPDVVLQAVPHINPEGLAQLKRYIGEYLKNPDQYQNSSIEVRLFLEKAKADDVLLVKYLLGRKNNPSYAWDTIFRYAENRFVIYPEIFTNTIPDKVRELVTSHGLGILKNRDKLGRRIVFINMPKWDASQVSLEDLTMAGVIGCESFWKDEDVLTKGIIVIENTEGFGMAHAKQHTVRNILRIRNVFMFSYPISVKGIFYLNMPTVFSLVFKMSKPLFPKKMRSRAHLYSSNQTPTELFDLAPPEILPQWAGGTLSDEEAAEDWSYFESKMKLSY